MCYSTAVYSLHVRDKISKSEHDFFPMLTYFRPQIRNIAWSALVGEQKKKIINFDFIADTIILNEGKYMNSYEKWISDEGTSYPWEINLNISQRISYSDTHNNHRLIKRQPYLQLSDQLTNQFNCIELVFCLHSFCIASWFHSNIIRHMTLTQNVKCHGARTKYRLDRKS